MLKDELISQITAYLQNDLEYVLQLKKAVKDAKEWETLINLFIEKAKSKEFKCKLLASENRLAELLAIILDNNGIFLMEQYETILKKNYSEKIIAFYSEYVLKEADRVSDRNGYKRLMVYLKKIFSCENGKSAAIQIADQWRIQYKRRPAMMDEMRKAGF